MHTLSTAETELTAWMQFDLEAVMHNMRKWLICNLLYTASIVGLTLLKLPNTSKLRGRWQSESVFLLLFTS